MTEDIRVSYGVKELLGRIDEKLANIDGKLDAKAEMRDVDNLTKRVDGAIKRIESMEADWNQQAAIARELKQRGASQFSRREKIISAAAGVAIFANQIHPLHL